MSEDEAQSGGNGLFVLGIKQEVSPWQDSARLSDHGQWVLPWRPNSVAKDHV